MRKNWIPKPSASGSYGRQAGWQTTQNTAGFQNLSNPLQVKLFGYLLCLYQRNVINSVISALQSAFHSKCMLGCVLWCVKFGHFFHVNPYYLL